MKLDDRIEHLCQNERLGGSVIRRDNQTLILHNCTSISTSQIDDLLRHHPRWNADIVARANGFLVIFSEDSAESFVHSCDFFCLLVSCVTLMFNLSILW